MAKLIDKYNAAKNFVVKDIWRADMDNMSNRKRSAFHILKILIIAVRGFIENGCAVRASALTYFTLLSSVPVVALAFALAKGFGLENIVTDLIRDSFAANPETANYLIQFSSTMLEETKGGLIAGIGVIMLLYSVFELLSHIEEAFNFMWNIKKNRPILRKVTDYMTIMVFSPILIITASSATFFVRAKLGDYFTDYLSPLLTVIIKVLPYILMVIVFTLVYLIMPNTKVNFKSAISAGVMTGIVFQVWQWAYVAFQVGVSEYGAVYGSFAALPLFLVWLQVSWIIVLLGCEVAYSVQNVNNYSTELSAGNISPRLMKRVSMLLMTKIIKNFADSNPPKDALTWSEELKISQKLFLHVAQRLQDVGLLAELRNDGGGSPIYIPAMDISKISVDTICSRIEAYGEDDNFPLQMIGDMKRIDKLAVEKEEKMREEMRKVLVKDI
ncbi:MAG: YihY/virulence factor BrkB family protein [Bacteroidales bacterium]|jgi:membrane protein|nr:YihY/virulence factor BrkB family protein [Bacteroidales bacterium]MBQ2098015.1 YihY/virulence factor BrkB family protein [Bacteroidales bacterium]